MNSDDEKQSKWLWPRRVPLTIVGALILAIVSNILYDLLVKPGLSSFGRLFLTILTLGSETLRNSAYSSAALDPTPVTGLMILLAALLFVSLPSAGIAGRVIANWIADREEKTTKSQIKSTTTEEREAIRTKEMSRLRKKIRVLKVAVGALYPVGRSSCCCFRGPQSVRYGMACLSRQPNHPNASRLTTANYATARILCFYEDKRRLPGDPEANGSDCRYAASQHSRCRDLVNDRSGKKEK